MKACRLCGRLYPDDAGFCPIDGAQLSSATQVPVLADNQDARIGQLLCDRYQVRRVVADGGMGRVYEALDLQMRRNVALKVLHPDVAGDEVAVERFKREFEVSALLPHDHIVEVFDFQATHDGSYALAMEYLYGEELRATLKREGTLAPGRMVRMVSQVAIGLDGAHARQLVHRDLKPDNLFLCQTTEGDTIKLLDFGSVKDKGETAKKLTVLGTTIGSPYYMAPEQAQGLETLDHRADVWALAAIIYECVTGTVPFGGINGPSILLEILTKDPKPPSQAAQNGKHPVPPTLDRVMTHAFKKQAAQRIGSVGALADAIGQAYGLSGTHQEWAKVSEADLSSRILAKLSEVMKPLAPAGPASIADSFFGEADALDTFDSPGGASRRPPPSAPASYRSGSEEVPLGVPKRGGNTLLFVAVGAGALVVGVLIAVALVLLK